MRLSSSLVPLLSLLGALPEGASASTYWPWQTYKSVPALQPPVLNVTKYGPTAPGRIFFDTNGNYAHNYSLYIMDDDGELVWQSVYGDFSAYRAQELDGKPVITFFNGITFGEPWGWGYGILQVLDDSYESIYNVTVDNAGFQSIDTYNTSGVESWLDMHEALITPEGTMLATAYNVTQTDLSSVGGPADGWLANCLFYEIDVKTNEILFQWDALSHQDEIALADALPFYPLDDYGLNQTYPWGPFHINTVNKFEDGSYLISSRHYCSVFKISQNGSVEWTLNVSVPTFAHSPFRRMEKLTVREIGTKRWRL
jgi:hypothetical protein